VDNAVGTQDQVALERVIPPNLFLVRY
jgi:hypothetical protein